MFKMKIHNVKDIWVVFNLSEAKLVWSSGPAAAPVEPALSTPAQGLPRDSAF